MGTERRKIAQSTNPAKMGKTDQGEDGSVDVIMPDGFGSSFATKEIRAKFVRKVYATLLSQLAITVAIMMLFIFVATIRQFYCTDISYDENNIGHCLRPTHNGFIVYIVSYVIFFITYMAIACCESVRRKSPGNMVAMGVFTLALSVMTGSIAIYHDVYWVSHGRWHHRRTLLGTDPILSKPRSIS